MQVIGLCRFSYPAEGGFQVEHDDIAARRAYLYAARRIEERFRLFEAVTLPALAAQTDPDFSFVILIDDQMPNALLDRLFALVGDMPQAVIVPRAPGPHRAVCRDVLNAARTDPRAPCIQFRLDDDDAVAVDFVARLRADAALVAGLCARNHLVTLDYNRGMLLRVDAQGGLHTREDVLPYMPMGMGMVVQGGVKQSIMNFAHHKVSQFMPSVTFTDSVMYVRGLNDYNDSRQRKGVRPQETPPADAHALDVLRDRFRIDAAHVARVFG